MQTKQLPAGVATAAVAAMIGGFALAAPPPSTAYQVLYNFNGGAGGGSPYDSGLISNAIGNLLYGTTYYGGANGYGTVYNITKTGAINLLHSFTGADGEYPNAGVIFDSAGNLYGTASGGGKYGYGVVFKVFASGNFKVIWNFGAEPVGGVPMGSLAIDSSDNIYGTTEFYGGGGNCQGLGCGGLWQISSSGVFTPLYAFTGTSDGGQPYAGVHITSTGVLWGTAQVGGNLTACPNGCGVVWKYIPQILQFDTVHEFRGSDGAYPYAGVTEDSAGNFYGTTYGGGLAGCADGCGLIYKIASNGVFSILHKFTGGRDGGEPISTVAFDVSGNLYGTTLAGGDGTGCGGAGCGVIYKSSNTGNLSVLHAFTGRGDGGQPYAAVSPQGSVLYGTANIGGSGGAGVVFKAAQ